MNRLEFIRFALPHLIAVGTFSDKMTAQLVQFVIDNSTFPESENDDYPMVKIYSQVLGKYEKLQAGRRRNDPLARAQRKAP